MNIQDFDKWIEIEDGKLITFGELSHRVAIALFPSYDEGIGYEMAMIDLPGQIRQGVDSGRLIIRNPVTREEDKLPSPDSVILPHDLRPYLAARGIGLRIKAMISPADTPALQPAAVLPVLTPQAAPASEQGAPAGALTLPPAEVQVLRQQERKILEWLKENGHDAQSLPKRKNGHGTVKAIAKAALGGTAPFEGITTFKKTWERLREGKEIQEVQE